MTTVKEYFDQGKFIFGRPGQKPEIKELEYSQLLKIKIVRFADLWLDIPVLKGILTNVEQGNSGVDVRELAKELSPDLYQFYQEHVPDKVWIIDINGPNYSVACRTFTVESAIELNKLI